MLQLHTPVHQVKNRDLVELNRPFRPGHAYINFETFVSPHMVYCSSVANRLSAVPRTITAAVRNSLPGIILQSIMGKTKSMIYVMVRMSGEKRISRPRKSLSTPTTSL